MTDTAHGPYETSAEVRNLPSVRAAYDAMHAGRSTAGECEKILRDACGRAGVALGSYDARIIRWLSGWEPEVCAVIAGLIERAAQPPEGTAAEWAVAYTRTPDPASGLPARRVVQPYPDEDAAREAVREIRRLAPGDDPVVMRCEVGPWKPAPGKDGGQ